MKQKPNILNSVSSYLYRPSDPSTLGTFRIFFGLLMVWATVKYFTNGWIKLTLIGLNFHFTYEWFPWITPLPGNGMYYHFAIMGISALFLSLGLFYRLTSVTFFLSYVYFFLIDKTHYNNHYYLICLLCFLFCIINANNWMSVDAVWRRKFSSDPQEQSVPYWQVLLVKFQVFVVYFYGGIAKLDSDWLGGEPLRHWLKGPAGKESTPAIIARFLESEFGVYFFSYGGLIFDLGIGFMLIFRKTRLIGFCSLVIFHFFNSWMFTIGIFPFMMIAATVIFLEPDTPRNFINKYLPWFKQISIELQPRPSRFQKLTIAFVAIYFFIQIFLPFRHWLYEGNPSWTEEGQRFSWRMKLREMTPCKLLFIATDVETGEKWPILLDKHLIKIQYDSMCFRPHMIIQYAHYLGKKMEETGIVSPVINAMSMASLNYRPPQPMIDPEVNLAVAEYPFFKHADWILPLEG